MDESLKDRFVALQEFIGEAKNTLSPNAWSYIIGGTETETTQRQNRLALDSLALRPRVLNDVSSVDSSAELFGQQCRLPVFLCPIGGLESFDENGALTVAAAAASFGVPMMLSSVSKWSAEQVSEETSDDLTLILQLYARDDAAGIDAIVDRAIQLDMPAFCITVDSAVYSRRERDIVARYVKPWRASGEGDAAHFQAALNWNDIARIRKNYDRPIILKGISTAEDALIALDHGVDTIYVSNHGGRQLDHSIASTTALPEIVKAVNGRATVLVDGGYCRGTDIAKALASGADGVGLGRMMCLALGAAGTDGVIRMLELLENEYQIALALLGATSGKELNESHLRQVVPTTYDHAFESAFPLLKDITY